MNNSNFYEGDVFHCRLMPKKHSFTYRFFWTAIGLDEMNEVFSKHPLWSLEKWNVSSFRRKDHLGDSSKPLELCVKELIENKIGVKPMGSVQLITHMAYLGFRFNPVSFYVLRSDTKKVEFIVAEINNTPWGEQFCYVIDARNQSSDSINAEMKKQFHQPMIMECSNLTIMHIKMHLGGIQRNCLQETIILKSHIDNPKVERHGICGILMVMEIGRQSGHLALSMKDM